MLTSSNGNIFRVTGPLCGEFTGHRWVPLTKASDAELWCFFICTLNERLSKKNWGWLFRSQSHSLWRHCNEICTRLSYPLIYCLSLLVTNIQDRVQGARRCAWLNLTTQFQFHTMYRHFPKIGTLKSAQPISVEHTRPPICVCKRHHTAHWPPERSTQISSFLTFRKVGTIRHRYNAVEYNTLCNIIIMLLGHRLDLEITKENRISVQRSPHCICIHIYIFM